MSGKKHVLGLLANMLSTQLSDDEKMRLRKVTLIHSLCCTLGQIKSVKEVQQLYERLENVSLSDLKSCLEELADVVSADASRDYFQLVELEQAKPEFEYTDKHMFHSDMIWSLNDTLRDELVSSLVEHCPTDRVRTSATVLDSLRETWQQDDDSSNVYVSSDLLVSGQICLLDMEIEIEKALSNELKCIYRMRVQICEDYKERIEQADDDEIAWVGILDFSIPNCESKGVLCRFGVMRGVNSIIVDTAAFRYGMTLEDEASFNKEATEGNFIVLVSRFLQTWYTIQLTMLNPMLKILFERSHRIKDKRKRLAGKKLANLSRPLNLHTVYMDDIKETFGGKEFNRKTMVWYVMGHWRKYQTGKMSFVAPYWKGPLRNVKSQSMVRERTIDEDVVRGK